MLRAVLERSIVQRLLSPAVALSLACPTVAATSLVPCVAMAAAPADDDAALAEARAMFERGRAKYDTFDYEGAIDLWQQAMQKVPENQAGVRNAMVYNIALAQEKAYDIDTDVAHLRQAAVLMETYAKSVPNLYGEGPEGEAELERVTARLAELRGRIEDAEAAQPEPIAPPTDPDPVAEDAPLDSPATEPAEGEDEHADAGRKGKGRVPSSLAAVSITRAHIATPAAR